MKDPFFLKISPFLIFTDATHTSRAFILADISHGKTFFFLPKKGKHHHNF